MEELEAPRELGDLGFKNIKIKIQNLGLLAKWWWRYSKDQGSLWKNVVKTAHGIHSNFCSHQEFNRVQSGPLKDSLKAARSWPYMENLLQSSFYVKVGNG